jgi:hypothetical protein
MTISVAPHPGGITILGVLTACFDKSPGREGPHESQSQGRRRRTAVVVGGFQKFRGLVQVRCREHAAGVSGWAGNNDRFVLTASAWHAPRSVVARLRMKLLLE